MVAELMAGQAGHCNFDTIPWVIYTAPEIAWVGKTEQQLKADGVAYKAGKIPFLANGRALGMGEPSGFVKMLACAQTDRILGVHIIGANASELISEAWWRWSSAVLRRRSGPYLPCPPDAIGDGARSGAGLRQTLAELLIGGMPPARGIEVVARSPSGLFVFGGLPAILRVREHRPTIRVAECTTTTINWPLSRTSLSRIPARR
jgi:hypothetical protein